MTYIQRVLGALRDLLGGEKLRYDPALTYFAIDQKPRLQALTIRAHTPNVMNQHCHVFASPAFDRVDSSNWPKEILSLTHDRIVPAPLSGLLWGDDDGYAQAQRIGIVEITPYTYHTARGCGVELSEDEARDMVDAVNAMRRRRRLCALFVALRPKRTMLFAGAMKAARKGSLSIGILATHSIARDKRYSLATAPLGDILYQQSNNGHVTKISSRVPQFIDGQSLLNLTQNPHFLTDVHAGNITFIAAHHVRYEQAMDSHLYIDLETRDEEQEDRE